MKRESCRLPGDESRLVSSNKTIHVLRGERREERKKREEANGRRPTVKYIGLTEREEKSGTKQIREEIN